MLEQNYLFIDMVRYCYPQRNMTMLKSMKANRLGCEEAIAIAYYVDSVKLFVMQLYVQCVLDLIFVRSINDA